MMRFGESELNENLEYMINGLLNLGQTTDYDSLKRFIQEALANIKQPWLQEKLKRYASLNNLKLKIKKRGTKKLAPLFLILSLFFYFKHC
jgi:hypothetical protein